MESQIIDSIVSEKAIEDVKLLRNLLKECESLQNGINSNPVVKLMALTAYINANQGLVPSEVRAKCTELIAMM